MSKDTPGKRLQRAIKAALLPPEVVNHLQRVVDRMEVPTCSVHPGQRLVCPACAGAWGGRVTSDRKARASRANGKKGGRPRKKKRGQTL